MKTIDNPPAFPHDGGVGATGMSLRDYFAAKVAATAVGFTDWHDPEVNKKHLWKPEAIAKHAYAVADAMLLARQKEKQ
jgi:hypothetical protein